MPQQWAGKLGAVSHYRPPFVLFLYLFTPLARPPDQPEELFYAI
jgi:hypothetical protein